MEKPAKYEVKNFTDIDIESTQLKQAFDNIGRHSIHFVNGDIVITDDNILKRVGTEIEPDRTIELLKSNSLKTFYPIESKIELEK